MMYLITVKHAGVVLEVVVTENPEVWFATEGKSWKARYSSAIMLAQYLGTEQPPPEETPKRKGTK